jgi:agmatinase
VSRFVLSPHLEVESASGDSVVMIHTRLGNRLQLNSATRRFLDLFKEPVSMDEVATWGPLEKALPTLRKLRRASFLIEEGHRETVSDKILQRIQPGFLGCPSARDETLPQAYTFLGVPFDFGNTSGPGARFGPAAVRRVSMSHFRPFVVDAHSGQPRGWYDNDLDRKILAGVFLADAGDLFIAPNESPSTVFRKLREVVSDVLKTGSVPVVLGGDHSITYSVLAAYAGPLEVVQIDAHTDLADYYEGEEHHHGNFMSRVLALESVTGIHQIGVRGTTVAAQTRSQPKVRQTLTPREFRRRGADAVVGSLDPDRDYYVTLDIDVLDPTFAPGTSTPLPGGLTFDEVKQLLVALASRRRSVGFDLVEINPQRDVNDLTAITAIELLLAFLGARLPGGEGAVG